MGLGHMVTICVDSILRLVFIVVHNCGSYVNLIYHNLNSNSCSGAKFKAFGLALYFAVTYVVMDSLTNNFSIGVTF